MTTNLGENTRLVNIEVRKKTKKKAARCRVMSLHGQLSRTEISIFFDTNKIITINNIDGSTNLDAPKICNPINAAATPIISGIRFFLSSHCSIKMTTNNAVIAKSIPSELNGSTLPATAPMIEPATQYT